MKFRGVLLKPLDQQGDKDQMFIDPAGVKFDEDQDYTIWREFNYTVPDDVLGHGKIVRGEDGSLLVEGEITYPTNVSKNFPFRLAIGVRSLDHTGNRLDGMTINRSEVFAVSFTPNHADPTQPAIEVERD